MENANSAALILTFQGRDHSIPIHRETSGIELIDQVFSAREESLAV